MKRLFLLIFYIVFFYRCDAVFVYSCPCISDDHESKIATLAPVSRFIGKKQFTPNNINFDELDQKLTSGLGLGRRGFFSKEICNRVFLQEKNSTDTLPFDYDKESNILFFYTGRITSEADFQKWWWKGIKEWSYHSLEKEYGDRFPKITQFYNPEYHNRLVLATGFPIENSDLEEVEHALEIITSPGLVKNPRYSIHDLRLSTPQDDFPQLYYSELLAVLRKARIKQEMEMKNAQIDPEEALYWQGTSYLLEILKSGEIIAQAHGHAGTSDYYGMVTNGIFAASSYQEALRWRLHPREYRGYAELFDKERILKEREFFGEELDFEGRTRYSTGIQKPEELSPLTLENKGPLGVVLGLKKKYLEKIPYNASSGLLEGLTQLPLDAIVDITFQCQKDYETFLKVAGLQNIDIPSFIKIKIESPVISDIKLDATPLCSA